MKMEVLGAILLLVQELDDKSIELLEGRLTVRAPKGAKIEARRSGIMSAPESAAEETRVRWVDGDLMLVIMAYELFQTVGKDFERGAQAEMESWGEDYSLSELKLDKLRALSVNPSKFAEKDGAVFVQGAFVAGGDDLVQLVMVYVNPALARDAPASRKLARDILAALAPGKRTLDAKAGRRPLGIISGEKRCEATVPNGYVLTVQGIHDFTIYRLRKIVPLGGPDSQVSFYFGRHPSLHHEKKGKATEREGKVLGETVTWYDWTLGSRRHSEAILSIPGGDKLLMHVFMSTLDPDAVPELRKIVDSLEIAPRK